MSDLTATTLHWPSVRPEVWGTPAAQHGALDYAELEQLQIKPEAVLDFSVNSNPFGPSPRVREVLATVPLDRYPDREALALRRALAERLDTTPERLVVGNGTSELLWLTAFAFLRSGDRVVIIGPTFGEYARVAALMGAQLYHWTARPDQNFAVSETEVGHTLQTTRPKLAFVCNPNNPSGTLIPREVLTNWAVANPETLFVVDEAYHSFAPGFESMLAAGQENVLVVRSMTKDYALAGLRLGYAAGVPTLIEALARVRPAWNVNALALAAGLAALEDDQYQQRCLAALGEAKRALTDGLTELGWAPLPSAVHFFLMQVGEGAALRRALLQQGILVRDCASFGLPGYVRIATRRPEENARLLEALRVVAPGGLQARRVG